MTDHFERIPIRNDLLESIGRVNWLATRLHSLVRDEYCRIDGNVSDELFENCTLGGGIKQLRKVASRNNENILVAWCTDTALPAANDRNGLVHAIAITCKNGEQAMISTKKNGRIEYSTAEIDKVAKAVAVAITSAPP